MPRALSATLRILGFATLLLAPLAPAQTIPAADPQAASALGPETSVSDPATPGIRQLLAFRDSDLKFSVDDLMDLLRDHRHEGWVLAAYPDPKTGRPLIGAGFSLDLPEREHPQRDPLNPNPFIEPSSAQLWQAAGLAPDRLQTILAQYDANLSSWKKKKFRRKIRTLAPQITDQEATSLLRVAAIQAIQNAKAYCRNFDSLTAPRQMAMAQLVYQMGVNLEQFDRFLTLVNDEAAAAPDAGQHWKTVQLSLMQSQWARAYRVRAASVIAMLDPQYAGDPVLAERRVAVVLRPPVIHRRHHRAAASFRTASLSRHSAHSSHRHTVRVRGRRKA